MEEFIKSKGDYKYKALLGDIKPALELQRLINIGFWASFEERTTHLE